MIRFTRRLTIAIDSNRQLPQITIIQLRKSPWARLMLVTSALLQIRWPEGKTRLRIAM